MFTHDYYFIILTTYYIDDNYINHLFLLARTIITNMSTLLGSAAQPVELVMVIAVLLILAILGIITNGFVIR